MRPTFGLFPGVKVPSPEYTIDDMLRLQAKANNEIVELKQRLAAVEKERDERFTEAEVMKFTMLFVGSLPDDEVLAALRRFRKFER
jgi:hypothetical protein